MFRFKVMIAVLARWEAGARTALNRLFVRAIVSFHVATKLMTTIKLIRNKREGLENIRSYLNS
jgi:hypothetical protein